MHLGKQRPHSAVPSSCILHRGTLVQVKTWGSEGWHTAPRTDRLRSLLSLHDAHELLHHPQNPLPCLLPLPLLHTPPILCRVPGLGTWHWGSGGTPGVSHPGDLRALGSRCIHEVRVQFKVGVGQGEKAQSTWQERGLGARVSRGGSGELALGPAETGTWCLPYVTDAGTS